MDVETQAANVMGGKTARACDACMRRRARWYCTANDAFLCQNCDSSIHSANQLARRHERVRLRTSATSSSSVQSPTGTPVWYEGFTRKARTPRNSLGKSLERKKIVNDLDLDLDLDSNYPLVPEIGSEEGSFSFSSVDENEENLNCRVPVFDFPDMDMKMGVKDDNIEEHSFGFVPDSDKIDGGDVEDEGKQVLGDGLNGFFPLDMDPAEFGMDVENLLGEESCVDVKELGVLEFKEDENVEENFGSVLKSVKDEEEEGELGEAFCWNMEYGSSVSEGNRGGEGGEKSKDIGGLRSDGSNGEEECKDEKVETTKKAKKKSVFLRLDYSAVMTAWDSQGSPWTTGRRPEFRPGGDCWPDCLLQGFVCPVHVLSRSGEAMTAVGSMPHQQGRGGGGGGSDGEREARVLRYREKKRTRLFAKKIRYEVRRLNAEKRPRIKGRFVKRTSLLATAS